MALTVNTNIINDTDQYLLDAKNVKGSYVVVTSADERDALPAATTVKGSLCYVTGTAAAPVNKFYQYNGTNWVEKEFGTTTEASQTTAGLMSADDKKKLDGIAAQANKYEHPSTHAASMITGLAQVATSGSYNDLTDKPVIPADTNQKVKTGTVTFGANDTVEFVAGSNVSISGDATNKKITISSTDAYSHPKYDSKASGLYKITVDQGHVSAATAVTKSDITALGIPTQDTTYSNATADKDGLMSKTDKANLDTIVTSFSSDDSNTTIDTVKEVLKAFENAPEGTNIANALAAKSNVGHNHEVTTAKAAPQAHTHNVTVSGTTGANSGTAVTAVTGVAADGTATALTGVKASGTDTFIKTISGGEGALTSNTTTDDGIKYVESVTHTAATLSGTTKFNTDAIKDVTLSASTADTDGPAYVESVTHTTATLGGTTTFNTDAIKSVALTESTTSTDGPKYVKSISGGSGSLTSGDTGTIKYVEDVTHTEARLTGDTTFVKSQGVFSAGTLPSLTISAKAPSKITAWSAGTTPVLSATPTYTADKASANSDAAITALTGVKVSQSSSAAPGNHDHSVAISGTTSAPGANTDVVAAAYSNGVLTLSAVNVATGGHTHSYSASVTSGTNSGDNFNAAIAVSADGTASVAPNGHTHNYDKTTGITLTRGDAPSLTYSEESVGSASGWSTGSLPSLGTATTGTVGISGGSILNTTKYLTHTHTAASATERYMKATGNAASTGTVSISGGSITPVTKYMKKTTTAASTGTVGISGGSTTTSTKYLHHSHIPASSATTGTAVTGVASDGTAKVLTGVKASSTASVAPSGHTHSYGTTTALTTGVNSGTAVDAVTKLADATN